MPKAVPAAATARGLDFLDATCPLVSKVHRQAERLVTLGRHILFVGHAGHPEVIGTFGQVPAGTITLVETVEDAHTVEIADPENLGFLTQTTLSVDDTADIVAELQAPLSGHCRTEGRGYLLRHLQPPVGGKGDRPRMRRAAGDRRTEFVELAAAASNWASARVRAPT